VGATQLTGLRPCVATHFFGGVCVPCVVALDLKGFNITLVSHTVTGWAVIPWGKNGKRGGSRSKLDWKNPVYYTDSFLMRKKYVYIHSVSCDWLQSKYQNVKPHTNKITQVTYHKCFGSTFYNDCISSTVDVSMDKTWISLTAGNHRIRTTVVEGGISHERAKTRARRRLRAT